MRYYSLKMILQNPTQPYTLHKKADESMTNFYKWMTKRKRKDDNWIGDLARDMRGDRSWPIEESDVRKMHSHLSACGGCAEAHQALDMAWSVFTKQENKNWYLEDDSDDIDIDVATDITVKNQVTSAMRFNILKRDGYRCRICGRDASDGIKLEVDHIVARYNGGSNEYSNLWTLCFECNRGKRTEEL